MFLFVVLAIFLKPCTPCACVQSVRVEFMWVYISSSILYFPQLIMHDILFYVMFNVGVCTGRVEQKRVPGALLSLLTRSCESAATSFSVRASATQSQGCCCLYLPYSLVLGLQVYPAWLYMVAGIWTPVSMFVHRKNSCVLTHSVHPSFGFKISLWN